MKGLKGQAIVSVLFAGVTRGLGFVLRAVLGRCLGAEAMGICEMASGVQQLLLIPVIGGMPTAVSCLSAREGGRERHHVLRTAGHMVLVRSLSLMLFCMAAAPFAGLILGDMRVVPVLLVFAPALPLVGLSTVMDGCAYGMGSALWPALSETVEQLVRILAVGGILYALPMLPLSLRAAVPSAAGVLGEGVGLLVMVFALRGMRGQGTVDPRIRREVNGMAWPVLGSRMSTGAVRALTGLLLPRLLVLSGLTAPEAAAQLGKLQGMVLPLLFLPGIATGALASLGAPRVSALTGKSRRRFALRLTLYALAAGLMGAAVLYEGASFVGERVYRQAGVAPMLRSLAVGAVPLSLNHVLGALMLGMGRQRTLFKLQTVAGAAALGMTVAFTLRFGVMGAGFAMVGAQTLQCVLVLLHVAGALFHPPADEVCK